MLAGRRILVAVTGGIAAFKTAELVSALVREGAEVRVVMTRAARQFVGPATFQALTAHPVATELWLAGPEGEPGPAGPGGFTPEDHIALARWAELVVIAPATAHLLARMACGLADDLLTTFLLVTRAPILLAPAMNTHMLEHPQVQANLARVRERGAHVLLGAPGRLACGTEGVGRMAEPEEILEAVRACLTRERDLDGIRVLITAGRTEEPLDAVRYLSNRSSGRTGAALAREALARGARVTLVWGVADVEPPPGVELVAVRSAREMAEAAAAAFPRADVVFMAAAVADFRPAEVAAQKIRRREGETLTLRLEPTADILAELARHPARSGKTLVGFALEPGGEPAAARAKLAAKGVDLLVWNDPTRPGCGFGGDRNQVVLLDRAGGLEEFPPMTKLEIARLLLDRAARLCRERPAPPGLPGTHGVRS